MEIGQHIKSLQGPKLYIMDCKCGAVARAEASTPEHFRVPVPRNVLREFLQMVLGDPTKDDRESTMLLQKDDILIILAGHARSNEDNVKKELSKLLKNQKLICPRRGVLEVRLLYHNREFSASANGAWKPKKVRDGVHNSLPDPLENLLIVSAKETTIPNRERKYLDLPGECKSRGVGNLNLGYDMLGRISAHKLTT